MLPSIKVGPYRYKADGPILPSKAEAQRRANRFRKQIGRQTRRNVRVQARSGGWQLFVGPRTDYLGVGKGGR